MPAEVKQVSLRIYSLSLTTCLCLFFKFLMYHPFSCYLMVRILLF